MTKRSGGRSADQLRPTKLTYNISEYAAGSVLLELGKTKVLCAVTLSQSVPPFLRGKGAGWLTAEYAMLPTSTMQRIARESSSFKRNGRSVEISRIIGRALRAVVDFSTLGERTIHVDCDVLQADGGTRTACITGAFLALKSAQSRWISSGLIEKKILKEDLAAVSVAVVDNKVLLDPDYHEDSSCKADFNVIMTKTGKLVEIQGGAEQEALEWKQFDEVCEVARCGVEQLFLAHEKYFETKKLNASSKPAPLFSLKNRQQSVS